MLTSLPSQGRRNAIALPGTLGRTLPTQEVHYYYCNDFHLDSLKPQRVFRALQLCFGILKNQFKFKIILIVGYTAGDFGWGSKMGREF